MVKNEETQFRDLCEPALKGLWHTKPFEFVARELKREGEGTKTTNDIFSTTGNYLEVLHFDLFIRCVSSTFIPSYYIVGVFINNSLTKGIKNSND